MRNELMFDEAIEEAMSFASYMDVSELRLLYYGRNAMYVAFSDDHKINMSGFEGSALKRPYSVAAHSIDTVVGRKASTNLFYGHVFRLKPRGGHFVRDVKNFSLEDYESVKETLYAIPYIEHEELDFLINVVDSNLRIRSSFERFWNLTKALSVDKGQNADKFWRRMLIDLGYAGFDDPSGTGIIGERRQPIMLVLEDKDIEKFDIVPVQKYRTDRRTRIRDNVNRLNRLMRTARNRVAKRRTAKHRDVAPPDNEIEVK